jgi:ADP-ribose pyrophosphatase
LPNGLFSDDLVGNESAIEVLWQGKVVRLQRETFHLFGSSVSREIIAHPGAVGVIAIDSSGRFAFVKQYRQALRAFLVEPVAGLLDKDNESPLEAAQRELAEEAGLISKNWSFLIDLIVSPGGTTEIIRYFLAENCDFESQERQWTGEAEEKYLPLIWIEPKYFLEAVLTGKIHNSVGIAATFAALEITKTNTRTPPNQPWPLFDHLSKSGGISSQPLD